MAFKPTLAAVLLLSGCAYTQPKTMPHLPPVNEFVFDATFDRVWAAVLDRSTEKSWPIKVVDKASGFLTTDYVSLGNGADGWKNAKAVAYEPPGGFLNSYTWRGGARLTTTIFVSKIDNSKTRVKIVTHLEAFEDNVSQKWFPWESNGANEIELAAYIKNKLRSP